VDSFGWNACRPRMFHGELEVGFQLIGEFVGKVPAIEQMKRKAQQVGLRALAGALARSVPHLIGT
jgi:hypothetical protein